MGTRNQLSSKEIFENFVRIEGQFKLFSYQLQGISVWEISRWEVYRRILIKSGMEGQAHINLTKNINIMTRIKRYLVTIYLAFKKNPLKGKYKKAILVFDHPRKVLIEGQYEDIYTKFLTDNLDSSIFEVLERSYLGQHMKTRVKNKNYLDIFKLYEMIYTLIFKLKYKTLFSAVDIQSLQEIEKELEQTFQVQINLKEIIYNKFIQFKAKYQMYNKLFKKRDPKKIFLVVSYSHLALIAAAKANGIEVIELQHGVISPYNPAYSFPKLSQELKYFPDQLYLFGGYWKESVEYPISNDQLKVFGFPYLNDRKVKYKRFTKREKQILFISQGTIGKQLSEYAYQLAQGLKGYHVVYKLHPGEYKRWKGLYPTLSSAVSLRNFTIMEDPSVELYQLLAESEYQIGVSSNALFEGLAFDCKTIVCDLPSVEHMEFLINRNYILKASNIVELIQMVKNYTAKKIEIDYFFCKTNQELILK